MSTFTPGEGNKTDHEAPPNAPEDYHVPAKAPNGRRINLVVKNKFE